VEGRLEWRLDLDESGSEVDPGLHLKWYPGKVRWTEGQNGKRRAEVIGEGQPREFELVREYRVQITDLAHSTLSIGLGGTHDPETDPIRALIKGQRFFVKVKLPPKLAKEQGNTLTISFKDLNDGDTATLQLTAAGVSSAHRAVAYSHETPVTIADCDIWTEPKREPQLLSLAWIFGIEGACLDLDVDNGGIVEVRYGEAFQQVVVYNSWVQRGIARHAQGAERLHAILDSILRGNFSDTGLGGSILFMEDAALDAYWRLVKAYLEGLSGRNLDIKAHTAAKDIAWTSEAEKGLVVKTLRRTSKRFASEVVKNAAKSTWWSRDATISADRSPPGCASTRPLAWPPARCSRSQARTPCRLS